jgi:hypothetical protein
MAPIRGHVQEGPQDKGPLMQRCVGQPQGTGHCPSTVWPLGPVHHKALIVEDIEIESARAPGATTAPARLALDLFQASQECRRGQASFDERDSIAIGRLPGLADCLRLVKLRDRADANISAVEFLQRVLQGFPWLPPRTGKIGTKTDQNVASCWQLRTTLPVPMFVERPSPILKRLLFDQILIFVS